MATTSSVVKEPCAFSADRSNESEVSSDVGVLKKLPSMPSLPSASDEVSHANAAQEICDSSNAVERVQPLEIIVQDRTAPKGGNFYRQDSESDDEEVEYHDAAHDFMLQPEPELELRVRNPRADTNPMLNPDPDDLDGLVVDVDDDDEGTFCFPYTMFEDAKESAEHFVKKGLETVWKATHFYSLPPWLQDNDFLHHGHRPAMPSFGACFKSIFRIHTETGNIWSHLLGCAAFIGIAGYFLSRPLSEVQLQEKFVFSAFFLGAIACLGLSFAFHTVYCHSQHVGRLFSKLDYCGITLLIMGSFVPWLFYGFYCRNTPKIVYMSLIVALGIFCIIVSLWDKFSEPRYRPLRAGLFVFLGLSGIVPCIHYMITDGFWAAVYEASLGWLVLMAVLYLTGTAFYAFRIPERFFPGKFDLWFQSHQIFHLFVVIAAFVHYYGTTEMAMRRLSSGSCEEQLNPKAFETLWVGGAVM